MQDVREHEWMRGTEWEKIQKKKLPSPFIPDVRAFRRSYLGDTFSNTLRALPSTDTKGEL